MPIYRTPPEKLEQAQNRLGQVLEGLPAAEPSGAGNGGAAPAPPNLQSLANLEAIRKILAINSFGYAGRQWRVRTLPFELGCALLEQDIRVRRIAPMVASNMLLHEYRDAARQMARIIWQIVEPADRWGRIRRRLGLMRNPFLRAGDADLGGIKDFCLTRRMASTVVLGGTSSESVAQTSATG